MTIQWVNMKNSMANCWEIWCKSIGEKAFLDNRKADKVAILRTIWVLFQAITCCFIIASGMVNLGWI